MKGFSIEVKVGMLILTALLLMGGFLFALGGVSLKSGFRVYVDFNNPGGLKVGAPVRVAGQRVGTVEKSEYLGGKLDPKTGRKPLVRLEARIDEDVHASLHDDAIFYITSQGILGEPFLAIDPGSDGRPTLGEDQVYPGIDPPRLDLALSLGFELLETMVNAVRANRQQIGEMMDNASGVLRGLNEVLGQNKDKLSNIITNLEKASENGNQLLVSVRENYVEGPQVKRIVNNLDKTLAATGANTDPLMKNVGGLVADARDVLGPEQREKLKSTIGDVAQLADKGNATMTDAQKIVGNMKRGEGTVGALLMDEEIYDDVQEMLRDLKHNPWKLFWRE